MTGTSNGKNLVFILISVTAFIMIICLGPADLFTHGNYSDAVNVSDINPKDFYGQKDLGEGAYQGWFIPVKKHFTGFKILLDQITEESEGDICVTVTDEACRTLAVARVKVNQMTAKQWYMVPVDVHLRRGVKYGYKIEAEGCTTSPCLQIVDTDYLGNENKEDGVLIGYMYAEPTFTFPEKVLFVMIIVSVWLATAAHLYFTDKTKRITDLAAMALMLVSVMTWNYMFHSLNDQNTGFADFQKDSETLVTGVIYAERGGVLRSPYGLGRYSDLRGEHTSHSITFVNDENWLYGYSRTQPMIAVANSSYMQPVIEMGKYIRFANGDVYKILKFEVAGAFIRVSIDKEEPLNYYKYGSLLQAQILDKDMRFIITEHLEEYGSQYGLQGKIFRHMARHLDSDQMLQYLNFLCSLITAFVFAILTVLLAIKYNIQLAGCFYIVFLLSPWIANFAGNLYWVEFTWFLPMVTGLCCSMFINKRICRMVCYILIFLFITGKCLCGYEYITTVMLGAVMFLIADFCVAVMERKKEKLCLILRTTVIAGIMALSGFLTAICIHAQIRGNGDIRAGVQSIIQNDVLRRTIGGDMNKFDPVYWESIQASVWDVVSGYFHFTTELIAGVPGSQFPCLCLAPPVIFVINYINERMNWQDVILYAICFAVSVSWYILGKQHSYIHVHMNYVLWYFGYVQMCFYIILKQITIGLHQIPYGCR